MEAAINLAENWLNLSRVMATFIIRRYCQGEEGITPPCDNRGASRGR